MIRLSITFVFVILIQTSLASHSPAQGLFHEDFTTIAYNDTNYTSADWSTEDGEIRLFPFEPSLEGIVDTPGNAARSIAISGRYIYIADGYAGIQIMDLKVPETPVWVGAFPTPGYTYQTCIDGKFAYVADHSGDLRVLDISDPLNPSEITSLSLPGYSLGITVDGTLAFIGAGTDGVMIVDISQPSAPSLVGSYTASGIGARNIAIVDNMALVTSGDDGLLVLDISDPTAPVLVDKYGAGGFVRDLVVQDQYAFLSVTGTGLEVLDISDLSAPALVGVYPVSGAMRGLQVHGNRLFVTNETQGLLAFDITNPVSPELTTTIDTPGHAYDVEVAGAFAFVPIFGPGLQSIRIAQFTPPVLRGNLATSHEFGNSAITGNFIYVPKGSGGVEILDVSDPDSPLEIGFFYIPSYVRGVTVSGNTLLIAANQGGLYLADITDRSAPVFTGMIETPGNAYNVVTRGPYAFVACISTLQIIDFSDPATPQIISSYSPSHNIDSIVMEGNLAFLYNENAFSSELEIVDLAIPTAPSLVGRFTPPGIIHDLAVNGDELYLAAGVDGLLTVDISTPSSPVLAFTNQTTSRALSLQILGKRLLLSTADRFIVHVLNINSFPLPVGSSDSPGYSRLFPAGELTFAYSLAPNKLCMLQTTQHEVDLTRSSVYSPWILTGTDDLVMMRLKSIQDGTVDWNLGANYGLVIQYPDLNTWYPVPFPGSNIYWDAKLKFSPGTLSTVSDLKIEWLFHPPSIESISDVPNDQGRQVSLEWSRSGHDFIGDSDQIMEYAVYRKIDGGLAGKAQTDLDLRNASASLRENIVTMNGAGWHFLTTVPPLAEDRYAVVVPTLADSTTAQGPYQTTFKVVALTATPGIHFTSHPDSGSSVDNLAPGVPQAITAYYQSNAVELSWEEAPEEDFRYFKVYRSNDPGFVPADDNLLQEVASPAWNDLVDSPWQYFYKISAVDFSGNESPAGEVLQASPTMNTGLEFSLQRAVPNPFNPSTRLNFSLAESGKIMLAVYDVAGHLVRTLVDENLPAGNHHIRWDGKSQAGTPSPSGTYFALLRSGSDVRRQRMLLIK